MKQVQTTQMQLDYYVLGIKLQPLDDTIYLRLMYNFNTE